MTIMTTAQYQRIIDKAAATKGQGTGQTHAALVAVVKLIEGLLAEGHPATKGLHSRTLPRGLAIEPVDMDKAQLLEDQRQYFADLKAKAGLHD